MVLVASAGTDLVDGSGSTRWFTAWPSRLIALALTVLICAGLYWALAGGPVRAALTLVGGLTGGLILLVTPTAGRLLPAVLLRPRAIALFLMLAGIFITCYLAALGLLLGAGVMARVELGRRVGSDA